MAGGYDGSLKFDTKIDQSGFEAGISTLTKALDRLTQSVDNLSGNITKQFHGAGEAASGASKEVESIGEAAKTSERQVQSLQEQMDAISVHTMQDNAADVSQSAPVAVPVSPESMTYDPKAMAAVFGESAAEIHNYAEAVEQYGNQAGMAMNQMGQSADTAAQEVSSAASRGAEETEDSYISLKDSIVNAYRNLPKVFGEIAGAAKNGLSKIPGITKAVFRGAIHAAAGFGKALGRGIAGQAKRAVASLKGLGKTSNKVSKSILKLSSMFKLMLIRMAMRAAVQGVRDGMENLVQYSDSANRSMSNLMSGMTYLKNSFAAAFAPILSIAAPALNTLINLLATAINYLNQFFAALGGSKTFVRAKKVNEDYAKSIKSAGGAAKQAGKDAKKALAPFDELNQIQEENAAGGGGGGGASASDMFETTGIEQGISDFAKKLQELYAAGDWKGIGKFLGQKVNESVQEFTDYISWDQVGAEITLFIMAFTALFNSLIGTIDWYSIGILMGTGINTLANTLYLLLTQIDWQLLGSAIALGLNGMVHTVDWNLFGQTFGALFQAKIAALYGFVTTADWPSIGQAIGNGLDGVISEIDWSMLGLMFATGLSGLVSVAGNFASTFDWTGFGSSLALSLSTFFQNFDWAGAGTTISDVIIGLLNALLTFIIETDWWAFGDGIATAMENIDWPTVASRLFMAIGAALGGFAAFLGGLVSDGVESAEEYFRRKIEECGGNVVDGIFKGILDAMSAVGAWIKKNIFDPFLDGFKKAFGIHSPSTVMEGMGKYLWDGFCNGVKKFFANPGSFIKQYITDPFVNGIKGFLGIHSPSTVLEDIGGNTVSGFNQGVEKNQNTTQKTVQSWAKGVASWFSEKLGISNNDSKESEEWANSIMSGYNSTVGKNYTKSQSIMETWAEAVRNWYVGKNESKGVNEAAWKKFADTIIKAYTAGIQSGSGSTKAPMETWAKNIREWFWGGSNPGGTGGLYQSFHDMGKRINEGFANGTSDFSYLSRNAMKRWGQDIIRDAKASLDIHSPSKEAYSIAEFFVAGFNDGLAAMTKSSVSAAEKLLSGVTGVFDGASIGLPVGLSIPNAASYLPRMAAGTVAPPQAGVYNAFSHGGSGEEETENEKLQAMKQMLKELLEEVFGGQDGGSNDLVINLNGKPIYEDVIRRIRMAKTQTGKNPALV